MLASSIVSGSSGAALIMLAIFAATLKCEQMTGSQDGVISIPVKGDIDMKYCWALNVSVGSFLLSFIAVACWYFSCVVGILREWHTKTWSSCALPYKLVMTVWVKNFHASVVLYRLFYTPTHRRAAKHAR